MFILAIVSGFVVAELSVYSWHRWVCHAGVFRRLASDHLRRHHFHHHVAQYSADRLQTEDYVSSCDSAFRPLGIVLLAAMMAVAATGAVRLVVAGAAVAGMAVHGWLGAKLHELYHVSDQTARRWPPLRSAIVFRAYERLRRFHDGHHSAQGNYGLVLPMVDVLGGTRVTFDRETCIPAEELFPNFDRSLSSACSEAAP